MKLKAMFRGIGVKFKNLDKLLTNASREYSKRTSIRALVPLIPYVGSSIDVLLGSKAQKFAEERKERLYTELKAEIEKLDEPKIDKEYLQSEEWFDILLQAIDKTVRTRSKEKIKLFAKVLKGALLFSGLDKGSRAEEYLNVLSELTINEVRLAKVVFDLKEVDITREKDNELFRRCTFIDKEDFPFYMKRLEKAGLVREMVGMIADYEGGIYKITATFTKMMDFLNE